MTPLKYGDRIAESTVTTGTGAIALAGAIDTDHAAFSSKFADGDLVPVTVFGGGKWMTFIGTYNSGANTFTRTTFRQSSTGSNLSLSGTMTVMCSWLGDDAGLFQKALRGHIFGLTLSNAADATNDISVAAGDATDNTNEYVLVLASAIIKQLDAAWAVGTNAGGLDTGSIANATYHMWLIQRSDTGVVDALFSLSASAPTMPTSYDRKRRIGSIVRAGATILAFTQIGDDFTLTTPVLDHNASLTGANTVTLGSVPTGVAMLAKIRGFFFLDSAAVGGSVYVSALTQTDSAPSGTAAPLHTAYDPSNAQGIDFEKQVRTNTSSQIRVRPSATSTVRLATDGWIDRRDRDA